MAEKLLTPVEVAGLMGGGVSRMTVLRRIHSGELEATNIAPRKGKGGKTPRPRWRISESALARYLDKNTKVPARRVA